MTSRGARRVRCWTWSNWTIGDRHLEFATLTLESRGYAHFECVTSSRRPDGAAEPWSAGFSLETQEGVRLHAEAPRAGTPMAGEPGARHRWSFDFTYEPSTFARIGRVVQNAAS